MMCGVFMNDSVFCKCGAKRYEEGGVEGEVWAESETESNKAEGRNRGRREVIYAAASFFP